MHVLKMFDLTGKVAVITGAGSGLGWQFAEAMAEAGASVVCADMDADRRRGMCERLARGRLRCAAM
jgi:NAD(P)-dependent dehydrogenase (short-subunit alcohol dehydrogenase family)